MSPHTPWTVRLEAEGPIALPSGGPDPFSLADPPAVTEILEAAGFADVTFTDVHERGKCHKVPRPRRSWSGSVPRSETPFNRFRRLTLSRRQRLGSREPWPFA